MNQSPSLNKSQYFAIFAFDHFLYKKKTGIIGASQVPFPDPIPFPLLKKFSPFKKAWEIIRFGFKMKVQLKYKKKIS